MRMFNSSGRRSHKSRCHDAGHSRNHSEAFARKFASDSKMTRNLMRRLRSNGGYALVFVVVAMTMALAIVGGISASSVTNMKKQQAAAKKMEDRYVVAGEVEKVFAQISEVEPAVTDVPKAEPVSESESESGVSPTDDQIEAAKKEAIKKAKDDAALVLESEIGHVLTDAGISAPDAVKYDSDTETFTVEVVKKSDVASKAKINAILTVNVKFKIGPKEPEVETTTLGGEPSSLSVSDPSAPASTAAPLSISESEGPEASGTPGGTDSSEATEGGDPAESTETSTGSTEGETPSSETEETDTDTAPESEPIQEICTATISGITYTDYEVTYGEETESEGGT